MYNLGIGRRKKSLFHAAMLWRASSQAQFEGFTPSTNRRFFFLLHTQIRSDKVATSSTNRPDEGSRFDRARQWLQPWTSRELSRAAIFDARPLAIFEPLPPFLKRTPTPCTFGENFGQPDRNWAMGPKGIHPEKRV